MDIKNFNVPNIGDNDTINCGQVTKPMLDYTFEIDTDKNGKKYLLDVGKIPRKNTPLITSRGTYFNGQDQCVLFDNCELGDVGFINVDAVIFVNDSPDMMTSQRHGNRAYLYNSGKIGLGDTGNITTGFTPELNTSYNICLTWEQGMWWYYVNGKLINTGTYDGVVGASGRAIGRGIYGDNYYSESVLKNFISGNIKLSSSDVMYLYKYPHKFLYIKDNELKSFILKNDDINKISAYIPLCETNEYITNLVNLKIENSYSIKTISVVNDDEETSLDNNDINNIILEVTTEGTNDTHPILNIEHNEDIVDGTYAIEFDYIVDSGTCVQSGLLLGDDDVGYIELNKTYKPNGRFRTIYDIKNANNKIISIYFKGSQLFKVNIINFRIKKFTGITKIINFTTSCKYKAEKIDSGLQTALLDRDEYGIIKGLNNFLSYCGIKDNLRTFPIPFSDTKMANGFIIEMVHRYDHMFYNSDRWIINNTDGYTGLRIQPARYDYYYGKDIYQMRIYLHGKDKDGNDAKLAVGANCSKHKFEHIVFEYDGINKLDMYVNGIHKSTKTITLVPSGIKFSERDSSSYDFSLKLFKIYDIKKDISILYQEAVKKGLLNE